MTSPLSSIDQAVLLTSILQNGMPVWAEGDIQKLLSVLCNMPYDAAQAAFAAAEHIGLLGEGSASEALVDHLDDGPQMDKEAFEIVADLLAPVRSSPETPFDRLILPPAVIRWLGDDGLERSVHVKAGKVAFIRGHQTVAEHGGHI